MSGPRVSIRNLGEADFDVADDILKDAFGFAWSSRPDLHRYLVLQPDGWFLALRDGQPVGMVGAVDYGRFAYVGLMAVHPNEQSRGVGRALMQHLLAWLEARGTPIALLDATEAGRPLYASLGFQEEDRACILAQQEPAALSGSLGQVRLLESQDVPALVAFDAAIFGAERGAVLRTYIADHPGRFLVVHDEAGRLSGYLCAQARRLGPWAALRRAKAEALLQAALLLHFAEAPRVIVPGMNGEAVQLLENYGFGLARSIHHMRRGGALLPSRRQQIYGQASFAIG